jgi:GNAT superfamily N-acetyltransferase
VSDSLLTADPHIVKTWVTGWALSRGTPAPVRTAGAFRIEVGLPQHKARYIFSHCSDDVRRLAETIHDPDIFIKVCSPPEPVQDLLPSRWMIDRLGFMMTRYSSHHQEILLPAEYKLQMTCSPPILIAQITDSSGFIAAQGRVALVERFAVYDQIETHEQHRRRGLGRVVMHALRETAARRGVDQGVLVATPDGRALYATLGWQMHSLYTTAAIRRDHASSTPAPRGGITSATSDLRHR